MKATPEQLRQLADVVRSLGDALEAPAPTPASEYIPEEELVAILGTKERVRKLVRTGKLEGVFVGRRIVVTRSAFERMLEAQRRAVAPPANDVQDDSLEAQAEREAMAAGLVLNPRRR